MEKLNPEDLIAKDSYGQTPFHNACLKGNFEVCKFLAEKLCKEDLITINMRGQTTFHTVCSKGFLDICELLVEKLDHKDLITIDLDKNTPLHLASKKGLFEICKVLVENLDYEDLNAKNQSGTTPLQEATDGLDKENNSQFQEICDLLLKKITDLNPTKRQNYSPNPQNSSNSEASGMVQIDALSEICHHHEDEIQVLKNEKAEMAVKLEQNRQIIEAQQESILDLTRRVRDMEEIISNLRPRSKETAV